MEIWENVKGYEGFYEVSSLGRIKNSKTGKILTPCADKDGYQVGCLHKNGRKKMIKWHRAVAMAFLAREAGANQVNHKDGDKKNNCVNNLEWCTASENVTHRLYTLNKEMKIKRRRVRCIETEKEYPSMHQAARELGGSYGALSQALNPNTPTRHTFKGLHWEYI